MKLVIEIDGSSHLAKNEEDYNRQQFIENQGYVLLRFPENLVVYRMDEVISEIDYAIKCLEQKIEDRK